MKKDKLYYWEVVIIKTRLYIVIFIIAIILLLPKPQTPYSGA